MAWGKAGSTTLSSSGDNIDVTGFADNKVIIYLNHNIPTGSMTDQLRFDGNSGSNYAFRYNNNGVSESTLVNQSNASYLGWTTNTNQSFSIGYIANISTEEKIGMNHSTDNHDGTGAGTATNRRETVFKLADTTNSIDEVNVFNSHTGSFDTGSNLAVLGSDLTPAAAIPAISNIEDNSLFVEKENARRYWFDGTNWTMQPTYPYSSTGWTATGGGAVATDNLTLALDTDGGQDQVNYDLTSISSDKFVLDFTLNFSRLTIGTNIFWFMGLVNSTNWISTNSTNHMGIFVMQESGTKTFSCSDGTGTWNGASEDAQTWTPSTGVDYYFRLTKLTSTTYKVELFGDSARTSVTSTSDGTVSSMTDLRYLVFTGDNNSGTGNATFTISDLKFYDGVSSIN